jgi:hypothetical protein
MRGQQRIPGDLRSHRAVTQDELRQDGEDGFTPRTLDAPDGEPAQTDADVMRVARQAPTAATGCLVLELKPEREEERQHQFEKRLAVTKQLKVGGFVLEIDGDRPIFAGLASLFWHGASSRHWVCAVDNTP